MAKTREININTKSIIVFSFSLVATGLFVLLTLFATSICEKFYGLIIGVILMLAAIPLHRMGKDKQMGYVLSFLVNSIANGFSLSAYYVSKNIALNVADMLKTCFIPIVLLFVVYLLVQFFPQTKKYVCASSVVICCIMLVIFAVLWIRKGAMPYSFGFFTILLSLFYHCVFALTVNNERLVLRDISFGSFGAFVIISIVVLFILTEGEILEGFDVGGGESKKKVKHKKNK